MRNQFFARKDSDRQKESFLEAAVLLLNEDGARGFESLWSKLPACGDKARLRVATFLRLRDTMTNRKRLEAVGRI